MSRNQALLTRIESRIFGADNGCLEWLSTLSEDGYGKIVVGWNEKHQPIRRYAHRVFYELVNGAVKAGLELDHLCRNRACVNPDHLEMVTRKENVRRGLLPQMMRDKAMRMTHCKRGHPYIEENKVITNSKTGAKTCKICRNNSKRKAYHMKKISKVSMKNAIQHGECMLVPIPDDTPLKGKTSKHKSYIVAHSESSHHHVLKSKEDFEVVMDKLEMYLLLNREAELVHEKTFDVHPTKIVKPGKYQVIYKTEYSPATKVIERVTD